MYRCVRITKYFILPLLLVHVESTHATELVTTLKQAIETSLAANPELKAAQAKVYSAQALSKQARAIPNPELSLDIENFEGQNDGFAEAETSITIEQAIELGGKRSARMSLANAEVLVAEHEKELRLLALRKSVRVAFAELLFSQEMITLRKEEVALAKRLVDSVKRKFDAGAVLPLEKTKAMVQLEQRIRELRKAVTSEEICKQNLASLWGGTADNIDLSNQKLQLGDISPYLKSVDIDKTPLLRSYNRKEEVALQNYQLARTARIPDITLGLGYRRIEPSETNTLLGSFSIGLPIFDQNAGTIESASEHLRGAKYSSQSLRNSLTNRIRSLQTELSLAGEEYEILIGSIEPNSKLSFHQAKTSFELGRSSYFELNDARRMWIDSRVRTQESLLSANKIMAELEQLSGLIQGEY